MLDVGQRTMARNFSFKQNSGHGVLVICTGFLIIPTPGNVWGDRMLHPTGLTKCHKEESLFVTVIA
jgi:hypothetical protein